MHHPLSFLLILFVSAAAALPATPAAPTAAPTSPGSGPGSGGPPPPVPFLPTGTPALPTGGAGDDDGTDPTPSPIYSTLDPKFPAPSNSSSSSNSSSPCASIRRPLRLGPARFHKNPPPTPTAAAAESDAPEAVDGVAPAAVVAAAAAAAAETPTEGDGPRDYASLIPPAPGVTPRPEPNLAEMGYYQTTYYSCATRGTSTHCGWHRPVVVAPANGAVAAAPGRFAGRAGAVGALVAGVVGLLVAG